MLQLPEAPPIYRIISIDPGSDTLGVALLELDLSTYKVTLRNAVTLKAARSLKHLPFTVETFGERYTRLQSHARDVYQILLQTQPQCVISEAPYMGRFPQAFETLVECLYMLREVVVKYDPAMCLETIDSPSAKKAVGAPGKKPKGMGKEEYKESVRKGILKLKRLQVAPGVDLLALDEHAIDAIAVGCYKLRCIANDII